MNAMMNGTQLLYCDICDETINIKSKSKHINSKTQKHKEKYGTLVKQNEFIAPYIDDVNYILNDNIEDCRKNYFHSFENRCVYNIKITNIRNNEEVFSTITIGYMEFKSHFFEVKKSKK